MRGWTVKVSVEYDVRVIADDEKAAYQSAEDLVNKELPSRVGPIDRVQPGTATAATEIVMGGL